MVEITAEFDEPKVRQIISKLEAIAEGIRQA
jgi:hypothetical protein